MKTKIFYGRDLIGRFTCDGKRYTRFGLLKLKVGIFMKNTLRRLAYMAIVGWIAVGTLHIGMARAKVIEVSKEVIVPVVTKFEDIPMLVKICNAESGGRQFNKNGDVLRGTVDKSDIGFCQINERYNNDLARKLGYDIYTEQGNKDFAVHLFFTRGTEPWNASKANWNK